LVFKKVLVLYEKALISISGARVFAFFRFSLGILIGK